MATTREEALAIMSQDLDQISSKLEQLRAQADAISLCHKPGEAKLQPIQDQLRGLEKQLNSLATSSWLGGRIFHLARQKEALLQAVDITRSESHDSARRQLRIIEGSLVWIEKQTSKVTSRSLDDSDSQSNILLKSLIHDRDEAGDMLLTLAEKLSLPEHSDACDETNDFVVELIEKSQALGEKLSDLHTMEPASSNDGLAGEEYEESEFLLPRFKLQSFESHPSILVPESSFPEITSDTAIPRPSFFDLNRTPAQNLGPKLFRFREGVMADIATNHFFSQEVFLTHVGTLEEWAQRLDREAQTLEVREKKLAADNEIQKTRRHELDARDSELDSREEKLNRRENNLHVHVDSICKREQILELREADLMSHEHDIHAHEDSVYKREQILELREADLASREAGFEAEKKTFEELRKAATRKSDEDRCLPAPSSMSTSVGSFELLDRMEDAVLAQGYDDKAFAGTVETGPSKAKKSESEGPKEKCVMV